MPGNNNIRYNAIATKTRVSLFILHNTPAIIVAVTSLTSPVMNMLSVQVSRSRSSPIVIPGHIWGDVISGWSGVNPHQYEAPGKVNMSLQPTLTDDVDQQKSHFVHH